MYSVVNVQGRKKTDFALKMNARVVQAFFTQHRSYENLKFYWFHFCVLSVLGFTIIIQDIHVVKKNFR